MPDDVIAVNRQSVVRAEVGKEHGKALDLLIRRHCLLEVAAHMDANR